MTTTRRDSGTAVIAASCCAFALSACSGGDGSGLPDQTLPGDQPFAANFSEIQDAVFTPSCATAGCHQGANAPQGLRLDAANSYGLLVDVASSQVPSILRVRPGDPDASYLIQKLDGTAAVGAQMPLNAQALPQPDIDMIRQWITDGAIDDRTQSTKPLRVASVSPLPNSVLASAPLGIVVMFDRGIDVSTLHDLTFTVERSGGDGRFADGNEIPVQAAAIAAPNRTATSAVFDFADAELVPDVYRLRLSGSGASLILDLDANALDGEFSGTFPSGDGNAGGSFEATFVITASPAISANDDNEEPR